MASKYSIIHVQRMESDDDNDAHTELELFVIYFIVHISKIQF